MRYYIYEYIFFFNFKKFSSKFSGFHLHTITVVTFNLTWAGR